MPFLSRRNALRILGSAPALLSVPHVFSQSRASSVVVAIGVDPSFAPLVAAVRKGFFEKHGLSGEYRIFDDGSVALDSLLTGAGHVGTTVEMGGLARRARGGQLFVTGLANSSNRFLGIAARRTIRSPEELAGRKVSLAVRGGLGHLFLVLLARRHGIDPAGIDIKLVSNPESVAALSSGAVDAAIIGEPWLSRATAASAEIQLLVTPGDADFFRVNDYFYFSKRMIDDPPLAQALMRALVEASDWVAGHQDEAVEVCGEAFRLPRETTRSIMDIFDFTVAFTPTVRSNFERVVAFQKSLGVYVDAPDLGTFLRPDILRAVAPERVSV